MNNINFDLKQTSKVFHRAAKHGPRAHRRYVAIEEKHSSFTKESIERSSLKDVFDHAQKQIQDAICSFSMDDIERTQKTLNKISNATVTLRTRYAKHAGNIFVRLGWIMPREKRETLQSADQLLSKVQAALQILAKISEGEDDLASLKNQFRELSGGYPNFILKLLKNSGEGEAFETCRPILEEMATGKFMTTLRTYDWYSSSRAKTKKLYDWLDAYLPYINYKLVAGVPIERIERFEPLAIVLKNRDRLQSLRLPTTYRPIDLPIWKKIARDCDNQRLLVDVYIAETGAKNIRSLANKFKECRKLIRDPNILISACHLGNIQILYETGLFQNAEFRREADLDDPFFRGLADLEEPITAEDFRSRALLHVLKKLNSKKPKNLKNAYSLLKDTLYLKQLSDALAAEKFTMYNLESLHNLIQKGFLKDKKLLNYFPKNPEIAAEPNLQKVALFYLYRIAKLTDLEKAKSIWQVISELRRLKDKGFDDDWSIENYRSLLLIARAEVIKEKKFIKLFGNRFPLLQTLTKQGKCSSLPTSIPLEPDFKLIGNDDVEVKAILPLMAMVSQYFKAMLRNNTLETDSEYRLAWFEEFKGDTLSNIVYFAETGALPANLSGDALFALKNAAEYFLMPTLSLKIDETVQFIDKPENVPHIPHIPHIPPITTPPTIVRIRQFSPFPPGIKMGNMYMTYREVQKKH